MVKNDLWARVAPSMRCFSLAVGVWVVFQEN